MKIIPPQSLFFDQGPLAVVLLHSYTGTPNDVRVLGRFLTRQGYSVYAPLFSGHGTNNLLDVLWHGNIAKWWQDTQEALAFVRAHSKKVVAVFGLSLGSIFATKALEVDPTIACGGVFGCPLFANDLTNVRASFFQYLQQVDHSQQQITETKAAHQRQAQELLPAALKAIGQESVAVREKLSQIQRPFFIGHGQADLLVDVQAAHRLFQQLNPLQTQLCIYPQAGHVITVNSAHRQLQTDVQLFLNSNLGENKI